MTYNVEQEQRRNEGLPILSNHARTLAIAAGAAIISLAAIEHYADEGSSASLQQHPIYLPVEELALKKDKSATCTTIRRGNDNIMFGTACTDNAKAITLESTNINWHYSVIAVNGIYKCGYIRPEVLPKLNPRKNAVAHCNSYLDAMKNERMVLFSRVNCPELLPGLEGCRDGSAGSKLAKRCTDRRLYGNYASDLPSPLNVFGTGNGGFSEPIGEVEKLIHFRAKLKYGSQDDGAAIVRAQKWGLVAQHCVRRGSFYGGTVTKLTADQRARIMKNPEAKRHLIKLEARQKRLRDQKTKMLQKN